MTKSLIAVCAEPEINMRICGIISAAQVGVCGCKETSLLVVVRAMLKARHAPIIKLTVLLNND